MNVALRIYLLLATACIPGAFFGDGALRAVSILVLWMLLVSVVVIKSNQRTSR